MKKPIIETKFNAWKGQLILVLIISLLTLGVYAQSENKRGGVCFRVDDNPSLTKLHQYDSIFSKYQQNFSMSITNWSLPLNPPYIDALLYYISKGHEVMDNTSSHQTQYINLIDPVDTNLYINDPAVDHFSNGLKVCLKYANIDTSQSHNEGLVNIYGNLVISQNPGEFNDLAGDPFYFSIYLSSPLNKICIWYDLKAKNPNDVDSVYVKSFWDEAINFGGQSITDVEYHKLTRTNVTMEPASIRFLGKRSLKVFSDLNITRPYTWIQPSGQMPYFSANEIKTNLGDSLGYKAGSNNINGAYMNYREYNPTGLKEFSMQGGNISVENESISWNIHKIANNVAKHYLQIDVSTLKNPAGGWDAYLAKLDSILHWCMSNNIPVSTYEKWQAILYDSIPNRFTNVFPLLNVDLDQDLFPDGYQIEPGISGFFSNTDGVSSSGGNCFGIYGNGNLFKISALGGVEKGNNIFTIWTKGSNSDSSKITVEFHYPEINRFDTLVFTADTAIWIKNKHIVSVPDSISIVNIRVFRQDQSLDTVKVSGMELRSAGFLIRSEFPPEIHPANEPFSSVNLNALVVDTLYSPDSISWSIHGNDTMNLSISEINFLVVQKPVSFWVGSDSAFLVGQNPDGIRDSCLFSFISTAILPDCAGMPITLTLLDTLDGDIIEWTSYPFDPSISNPHIFNPTVFPEQTTLYRVLAINPLGPINRDSITIYRNPYPIPDLIGDTTLCIGDIIVLTAHGGTSYLWSTGETTESINVSPVEQTSYTVFVTNEFNCSAVDSVTIFVQPKPNARLYGLWPMYCTNDWASTLIGNPSGGSFAGTSGVVENKFYPNLANLGYNKVWYTFTNEFGCSDTDTVQVNVVPLPVIEPLRDTVLYLNQSVTLFAGSGFDNYLWSNGSTDDFTIIDSTGMGLGVHHVWVYVTKDGCADRDTAKITFILWPIGIDEQLSIKSFSVFPNPSTQEVFVLPKSVIPKNIKYEVVDLFNRKLLKGMMDNNLTRINVSQLPNGNYILRITVGETLFNYRLIKTGFH